MNRRAAAVLLGVVALSSTACGGATTTSPASTATSAAPTTAPASTTTVPAGSGVWSLIPSGSYSVGAPVAWTGAELLVARAGCCDDLGSADLSAFDPANNAWHGLPPTPLTPRADAAGAWTGSEMVVAGGLASPKGSHQDAALATDGAAWVASTNAWHSIAPMPTTVPGQPTAVWTGREVLVWSSNPSSTDTQGREVVLAYNPSTNTWRSLPPSGLTPRQGAVTVWTGNALVVWGGLNWDRTSSYPDGARLDPVTGSWQRLPTAPVPARGYAGAAWSGREVLLWGGESGGSQSGQSPVGRGAAYDPVANRWRALPLSPLRAKTSPAAVWTGHFFIVIGGSGSGGLPVPGPGAAAYDPATNSWTVLPTPPAYPPSNPGGPASLADQRSGGLAAWTGTAALLVGGDDYVHQGSRPDGIEWTPAR